VNLEDLHKLTLGHPFHLLQPKASITVPAVTDAEAEKMRGMLERRFPHKYRLEPAADGFTFTRVR
jgi:hypothetical protein